MVTDDTPRSANVTALTHVKLVCINKNLYMKLNRDCENSFESIFAPHKRDTHGDGVHHHHVPKNNSTCSLKFLLFLVISTIKILILSTIKSYILYMKLFSWDTLFFLYLLVFYKIIY